MLHANLASKVMQSQFDAVFVSETVEAKAPMVFDIAITLSRTNQTVAIVDRDRRNPDVHLSGDQAFEFIRAFDRIKRNCPDMTLAEANALASAPYTHHWR